MIIWILQTGEPLQIDPEKLRPMRAINLANALVKNGHKVVVWSSDFNHFTKQHRFKQFSTHKLSNNLQLNLIPSIGYKHNKSVRRIIDHLHLAVNLRKYIRKAELPNIAVLGYPPIETAWVMLNFLVKKDIPTILDVKDAWPEIILRDLPKGFKHLGRIILFPYFKMMDRIFQKVGSFSAPSINFLRWCVERANRVQNSIDSVLPLTSPIENFLKAELENADKLLNSKSITFDTVFRVSFVGSLSDSFDFSSLYEASKVLPFQFVLAGDGPNFAHLSELFKNSKNVILTGRLSSVESFVLQSRSHVMIAPYKKLPDFEMSIPNKFYDYMKNGKPIISSLRGSSLNLLMENNIGLYFDISQLGSLEKQLKFLYENPLVMTEMAIKSRNLYDKHFSFNLVYDSFVTKIERIFHENRKIMY